MRFCDKELPPLMPKNEVGLLAAFEQKCKENAALRELLKEAEYVDGICPWCGGEVPGRLSGRTNGYIAIEDEHQGHTDNCRYAAAMGGSDNEQRV